MNARSFLFPLIAALFVVTSPAHAAVPQIVNYQGRITVAGADFNGTGQFRFALVSGDGRTTYWTNDGTGGALTQPTNAVQVQVANGVYAVLLGDTTVANMTAIPLSVFNNTAVFLRIWFDDGANGSQLLAPDQRIGSVGYSMISNVADGTITTTKIADGSVTNAKLTTGAVTNTAIADASITGPKMADGSISGPKIANFSISSAQLASSSVDASKLATGSVSSSALSASAVTSGAIADNAVTTAKVADNTVTTAKIADNAITGAKIADSSITAADLANNSVNGNKILDNSVDGPDLAILSVDTTKLVDLAVTGPKIGVLPVALVQGAATQPSVPTATWTALNFSSETIDTNALHDPAFPSRLRAPIRGFYEVSASVDWQVNGFGYRQLVIVTNTEAVTDSATEGSRRDPDSSGNCAMSTRRLVLLNPGGYVEAKVWQNSGAALPIFNIGSQWTPTFTMHFVSAAP